MIENRHFRIEYEKGLAKSIKSNIIKEDLDDADGFSAVIIRMSYQTLSNTIFILGGLHAIGTELVGLYFKNYWAKEYENQCNQPDDDYIRFLKLGKDNKPISPSQDKRSDVTAGAGGGAGVVSLEEQIRPDGGGGYGVENTASAV